MLPLVRTLVSFAVAWAFTLQANAAPPTLRFVSSPDNDVFVAATSKGNSTVSSVAYKSLNEALAAAEQGDGLLVLAEAMKPVNPGVPQVGFLLF